MTKDELTRLITVDTCLAVREQTGQGFVPVGVSNRHIHLTSADVEMLFGPGHKLSIRKELSQPGQFACDETVTLVGPRGEIPNVRVLGPERKATQIEISATDAAKLGVKAPVRMSGDTAGTPGLLIRGTVGQIEAKEGLIIAARHLHISPAQAKVFGLKDGDEIRLHVSGERPVVFEKVVVRCGNGHDLECHIDFDEANSAGLSNGSIVEILY